MADGDFPNRFGARLTVTMRSNEKLTVGVDDVRGTPGRPFASGEVLRKFYDCAGSVLEDGAPHRLAAAVDQLDRATNLAELTTALRCVR
jgi:hypothetical protein